MGSIADYEFDAGESGVLLSTTVGAKAMNLNHLKGKFSLSQNCMVILPRSKDLIVRFFLYHFKPLFAFERSMIPTHMQPSFRMEDLFSFAFALPPKDEQAQIADHLGIRFQKFSDLIGIANTQITLLQERRTALISAAVTGKIDVRDWEPSS